MRSILLHLSFSFVIVSSALCQESPGVSISDSTIALPEIRISSTRYTPDATRIAARIAHIGVQRIESTGGQSLDEVLQRASGVFLRQYGTGLSSLSMRGGNSSHSIIAIDGMPLYDPQLGQVDLSLVPSMLLENISIMYGQGASLYGANGVSGVVDIDTRSPLNTPVFGSIKANMGAFGERHVDGTIGFKKGTMRGFMAMRYGGEKGDFLYENPSLFPVESVRRQGADRLFSSYFGKLDWTHKNAVSTVSTWVNAFERGIPGPITLQFRDERQWDRLFRLNAQHVRVVHPGVLSVRAGLQRMSLRYANPFLRIDDTGQTSSYSLDTHFKREIGSTHSIKIGFDTALRTATHPSLSEDAQEVQTSLFVQSELRFKGLTFLPSLRADRYTLPGNTTVSAFSPNMGVNMNLLPALFLKAQAGKSFKPPTFNDRFWQPGGNPELRPEIGWGYEVGLLRMLAVRNAPTMPFRLK